KLLLPHTARVLQGRPGGRGGRPVEYADLRVGTELYDLRRDPGERRDLAARHPEVVDRLMAHVARARAELGDSLVKVAGRAVRQPGRVP
ncbi:MAG: arylsulfatase, partial [Verrucomicrobiota bacterium]